MKMFMKFLFAKIVYTFAYTSAEKLIQSSKMLWTEFIYIFFLQKNALSEQPLKTCALAC